jgi:hypothetical protein
MDSIQSETGPATSFSKEVLRAILNLPLNLTPEVEVCIGYTAPKDDTQLPMLNKKRITWQDLTDWDRFETRRTS